MLRVVFSLPITPHAVLFNASEFRSFRLIVVVVHETFRRRFG